MADWRESFETTFPKCDLEFRRFCVPMHLAMFKAQSRCFKRSAEPCLGLLVRLEGNWSKRGSALRSHGSAYRCLANFRNRTVPTCDGGLLVATGGALECGDLARLSAGDLAPSKPCRVPLLRAARPGAICWTSLPIKKSDHKAYRKPAVFVFLFALACHLQIAGAQSVLTNGSFEDGGLPTGWFARPGGGVMLGDAHHGVRKVNGETKRRRVVWESRFARLTPQCDYRLEGWIRCPNGEGRVEAELTAADGKFLRRITTPPVSGAAQWQYVVVEWKAAGAAAARVTLSVQGSAEFDDIALAPAAESFLRNRSVEGDERGRIALWDEEQNGELLPGRRAGQLALDTEVKRSGNTSVRLSPAGDWFALASVNYPVPPWTERMEISGWARTGGSATAQIVGCWTDAAQKVLRIDESKPVSGSEWQRVVLNPPPPPAQAMSVRLVAVARGGTVWFDDFDLVRLRPKEPRIRVFVNQVGYDLGGPKTAVVAANFLPAAGAELEVQLVTTRGLSLWKQLVPCGGRIESGTTNDWGWYFWRADFSGFQRAGEYRVTAQAAGARGESPPFQIERDVLLRQTAQSAVDFFFIQRCGFDVPGGHKACHLDAANLPEGTPLDATGGWHSADDYDKRRYENGEGGVVFALLTAQASAPEFFGRFDRDANGWGDALDEAEWGARFVAKMQIPETGGLRGDIRQGPGRNWTKWSAPEDHTDNTVGTADVPVIQPGAGNAPLMIGGWARLAGLLQPRGVTNDYLARAVRLWNHASKDGAEVGSPQLLLSALEMHRATGEAAYLDYARRSVASLLAQQITNGIHRGAFGDYGELSAGALASFALAYPSNERTPEVRGALTSYVKFCVGTAKNPFGLSTRTADEANGFFPSDFGHNLQLLMRAWAASLTYRVTHDARALEFAADQVDWILGKNPLGLCMFEGKGALNAPRYHHRDNTNPGHERGAVPGAIPNGFVREMGLADRPGFDLSRAGGRSPSFRTSEPWLGHNMWYLMAMSAWHEATAQATAEVSAGISR